MGFLADLRYGVRCCLRSPGLTTTLVAVIALGAGVNASLFGYIGGLVGLDLSEADPRLADRFARVAVLLAGASGLVFALAGSTVASLLLSRARARAAEMATRVAIGASDGALFRLCAADVVVVAVTGGAAGALLGWWTVFLFPLLFWAPDAEALVLAPRMSWVVGSSVLWFCALVFIGTYPAFREARLAPNRVLRRESAGNSPSVVRRGRQVVVAEIAIACLLLVVTSAIRQDMRSTLRSVRGEALGNLLVVPLRANPSETLAHYVAALEESIHDVPGLSGWTFTTALPGAWPSLGEFAVDAAAARTRQVRFDVSTFRIDEEHPSAIRPVAGRLLGYEDAPDGPRVALVNDAAAALYFDDDAVGRILEASGGLEVEIVGVIPGGDDESARRPALFYYAEQVTMPAPVTDEVFHVAPGGRRPRIGLNTVAVADTYFALFGETLAAGRLLDEADIGGAPRVAVVTDDVPVDGDPVGSALVDGQGQRIEVVGVLRTEPLTAAGRRQPPAVILPLRQTSSRAVYLVVATSEPPSVARPALNRVVAGTQGGMALSAAITLEQFLVQTSLAGERIATALLVVAAAVALAIAVVGVSGALADLVRRRRRELAVRLALGAGPGGLVWLVVAAAMRLAVSGLAGGAVLAGVVLPVLGQFIAGPRLPGAVTIVLTLLAVAALAVVASAVPAWRAARIRPREALS